jgi:hypothetical protein
MATIAFLQRFVVTVIVNFVLLLLLLIIVADSLNFTGTCM